MILDVFKDDMYPLVGLLCCGAGSTAVGGVAGRLYAVIWRGGSWGAIVGLQ